MIREVASDISILAEERRIRLVLDLQPVPLVLGDANRLKQVVINLVDNALRYTPSGLAVTLSLGHQEDWVVLTVTDMGPGIPSEHLPHLFKPFYRPDTARARKAGGAGLGLAIVKEIIEAHGGDVQVKSTPEKGSSFFVRLPVLKE